VESEGPSREFLCGTWRTESGTGTTDPSVPLPLFRLMRQLTIAANQSASMESLLQMVIDRLCERTGWAIGHAWRVDGTRRHLLPLDSWHVLDPRSEPFVVETMAARPVVGAGFVGRVASEKRILWWSRLVDRREFQRAPVASRVGIRTGFAFPVVGAHETLAVLEFFAYENRDPNPAFLEVMEDLGVQLGHVLEGRRADEKFRGLLESAPDAMVIVGQDGRIQLVNAQTERMFGYKRDELLGKPVEMLVPMEKHGAHSRHRENLLADPRFRPMGAGLNLYARRRDGIEFPAEISLSPLQTETGTVITAAIRDISRRKQLERQLSEAVWREQQSLGQELHDGLGGALTGLAFMSKALESKLGSTGSALVDEAARITDAAKGALEQVRHIAKGLLPVDVEAHGLEEALAELARSVTERLGVTCTFVCPRRVRIDDNIFANHLYRIAQEAVTNALRHGKPRRVQILLHRDPQQLTLKIEDDGCGLAGAVEGGGLGLHTMRQRAGFVGGKLEVQGRDGGGTVITCMVKGASDDVAERTN